MNSISTPKNKLALTVDEAATYTSVGRNTLRKLIKCGKLPVLFVGKKIVIRTDMLKQFLAANEGVNLLDCEQVKSL